MYWFLNTRPILMDLVYLLTCLNFRFLLNILCKQQTILSKQVLCSVFCMFGMTLTRPSLTMQLTTGTDVFAHVRTKGRHFEQLLWQYLAIWQETFQFLSRVSILAHDIDIAILSVRLSVCNVLVLDENCLTYCHSFFHHTVAQSFWFYQHQTSSRNSDGSPPTGTGALNTGGI